MAITTKPSKARKPKLTVVESKKSHPVPLIVEQHPVDYVGFPFVTLIQYRKQPILTIIDNADDEVIRAFVLDMCGPEGVDEDVLILVATEWYEHNRHNFPLSVEFSRRGMTSVTSKIYRALNVEFVSRVIGPFARYPMANVESIKRRRRKPIPSGVEVEVKHSNVEQLFE